MAKKQALFEEEDKSEEPVLRVNEGFKRRFEVRGATFGGDGAPRLH